MEELDLTDVERELCRLPDVTGVRIVDDGVRPTEVHVLARPGKPAKQIVRDVQSVTLARFGMEIDRRIVSVVQLDDDRPAAPLGVPAVGPILGEDEREADPRPVISGIAAEASGLRSLVRVSLAVGEAEVVGFSEGTIAASTRHRLVATATVDALRQIRPAAECLDVESAQIVRVGAEDVAVVVIVAVEPPDEQVISGSAVVRLHQEQDAMARAVLDATNRRLPRLGR